MIVSGIVYVKRIIAADADTFYQFTNTDSTTGTDKSVKIPGPSKIYYIFIYIFLYVCIYIYVYIYR